jgi:hypothetical protein
VWTARALTVTVSVQDRGPAFGGERFVAELEDCALVRESGGSAWAAIRELVCSHRALLERRWSEGGQLHDDALLEAETVRAQTEPSESMGDERPAV